MSGLDKIPVKAYFALAMVCIVWGFSWVASKEAVRDMPALQMAGIRQICAGTLYIAYFIWKGSVWPRKHQWMSILLLSFLNFVINNGFSTWALKYISAGIGSIIGASFPIWLMIISTFKYNIKPTTLSLVGILIGFLGICFVFSDHMVSFLEPEFSFGIFLSIAAAVAWTFGTIYTKEHALLFNPYFSLGLQMLCAGVVLTLICEGTGITIPLSEISAYSWVNIWFLVLVSSIAAFIAYVYILQVLPTNLVSIYAYINPIIAVAIGGVFFDEKLTYMIAIGIITTLIGVYIVNLSLRVKPIFKRTWRRNI